MTDATASNDNALTCGRCQFYHVDKMKITAGACRRFPPQIVVVPSRTGIALQPMHANVENRYPACGEYKPRLMT